MNCVQSEGGKTVEREEVKSLMERYGPSVYRLAYARTGNRTDAEDLTQEVFLCLLRKGPEAFREEEHAKAWLLRVTVQRANNLFRAAHRRREVPLEEAESIPGPESPEEAAVEAVQALPPHLRAVVHLFYYEDLTVAQIAGTLGMTEGAVRTRLSRARGKLRDILTEGGEEHV